MYDLELSESCFPAQGGRPEYLTSVGDMLRTSVAEHAERTLLKELLDDGSIGRTWTYSEFLHDAERLARALSTRHAQDARVTLYASNSPEWLVFEYACALAGITLVTANPAFQARELAYVVEQSESEAIYYVSEFRGNPMIEIVTEVASQVPAVQHRIEITDDAAMYKGQNDGELRNPRPDDPAQIQYTSGTTGFPKGAILHHQGVVQNAYDGLSRIGIRPGDVVLHHMPLFHCMGCGILGLGAVALGGTIVLTATYDPDVMVQTIEREKAQFLTGVPTMIQGMIDAALRTGADVSSVNRILSGGAMVAPELCRQAQNVFGASIQITYGQTEASPIVSMAWHDDSLDDLTQTIGQPAPHVEVSIRDTETKAVLPVGEQGELCVRGYLVMTGYNANPEATAAAIDAEGWLHTGDLGTMDARGYLKVTGRVKEMIIRGGENLFPAEIENTMLEHDAIAEVAVVGIPDELLGEQVACFMRPAGDDRPSDADLKAFARDRISPQKTPTFWVWVDEWPLTGSGKIRKFQLRDAFVDERR
ncbi:MAG: class I adenylate-forming enzyme family protein [Acidimicrobiales bacterium]